MAFTVAQILSDIMAKTNIRAIIAVSPYNNEGVLPCVQGKNNIGVITPGHTQQPFTVTVLDAIGDKCERRNIQIVVYDEGQAGEQAFYSQQTTPDTAVAVPDSVITLIKTYVTGLGVRNYDIVSYNADQQYAIVSAWIDTQTTCSKISYRIFHNGTTITHRQVA